MPLNTFKLIVFTFLKMLRKTVPRTTEIFYGRSLTVRISVLWWIILRSDGGLYWHCDISDHYSDTGSPASQSRLNWQIIWIFGVTVHQGSDHLPSCVPSLFMVRYLVIVAPLFIARSAPCCPPPDLRSPRIAPGSPMSRLTRPGPGVTAQVTWHADPSLSSPPFTGG